jgi:peptide-methionine (R)-S-oxide reductase
MAAMFHALKTREVSLVRWMVWLSLVACGGPSQAGDEFKSTRADAVVKTDIEWKKALSAEQYRILRGKGTERAFSGKFWNSKEKGVYTCGGCGLELFSSADKFVSGTGWPSFTQSIVGDTVGRAGDHTLGISRTEIVCGRCGGHLGHVFPDGPPPTGERYCVNGNALDFVASTP